MSAEQTMRMRDAAEAVLPPDALVHPRGVAPDAVRPGAGTARA
ncbi:hypothetical protein [Streptomyces sp. SID13726]|nr:hypothetical protein [Streptomyces sp. SID13726]